ncbi:hypothetical protein TIFTF001_010467 [Ficus carica]|uniref:Uncharacterized protein n=1 Tax=Ficus carica TaxID=3494 RepID=A0AA87ZWI8_FICCA|nr:hypothetical protein TIFTF001_010467 [Ficus carica]
MDVRQRWEGLVHRTGKSSRGGGRDWFAGQEKSSEAVKGTGGDGDPSSRCCGCRRAHDPRSPNVDEAALEDSGMPETIARPEGVKFDSVSRRIRPSRVREIRRRRRPLRFHQKNSDLSSASVKAMEIVKPHPPLAGSSIPSPRTEGAVAWPETGRRTTWSG